MDASAPKYQSALSTTLALLNTGKTRLTSVFAFNGGNATSFIQLFDAPAATGGTAPTLGTTTPNAVIPIPSGGTVSFETNLGFLTGLVVACTSTAGGSTAPNAAANVTFGVRNGV